MWEGEKEPEKEIESGSGKTIKQVKTCLTKLKRVTQKSEVEQVPRRENVKMGKSKGY